MVKFMELWSLKRKRYINALVVTKTVREVYVYCRKKCLPLEESLEHVILSTSKVDLSQGPALSHLITHIELRTCTWMDVFQEGQFSQLILPLAKCEEKNTCLISSRLIAPFLSVSIASNWSRRSANSPSSSMLANAYKAIFGPNSKLQWKLFFYKRTMIYQYWNITRRANCFKRLYFTNCRMFDRTEISKGISEASPPSLTHGCAGNDAKRQTSYKRKGNKEKTTHVCCYQTEYMLQ